MSLMRLLCVEIEPKDGYKCWKVADSGWRGLWNRLVAIWYAAFKPTGEQEP